MDDGNRLSRLVHKLDGLPVGLRRFFITYLFGGTVHFVRTAGLHFEALTEDRAVVVVRNRRRVQNHIGTVHASAMGLLGETATGAVVGMNVPDDRVPVLKGMRMDYLKRAQGALRAEASLTPEMQVHIRTEERGELSVPVRITDESGESPLDCEYVWAWRSRKKS